MQSRLSFWHVIAIKTIENDYIGADGQDNNDQSGDSGGSDLQHVGEQRAQQGAE